MGMTRLISMMKPSQKKSRFLADVRLRGLEAGLRKGHVSNPGSSSLPHASPGGTHSSGHRPPGHKQRSPDATSPAAQGLGEAPGRRGHVERQGGGHTSEKPREEWLLRPQPRGSDSGPVLPALLTQSHVQKKTGVLTP